MISRWGDTVVLSWRVARGWVVAEATAVVSLLGAIVWMAIEPGPEPALVGVVAAVGILKTGSTRNRRVVRYREAAQALFSQFLELLPTDGVVSVLRDRGLPPSWLSDLLNPLYKFAEQWRDAEREFLDGDLERMKVDSLYEVDELLQHIAIETFVVKDSRQGIPPEWEDTQHERYLRVNEGLLRRGDAVVESHQDFIRLARRRLEA